MSQTSLLAKLTEFTRYLPFISSILCIIAVISETFHIHLHVISWFAGMSLVYIYSLYILSYLLKFCWKHRLAIHFLSTYWLISFIDSIFQLSTSDTTYTLLILFIALIFISYYFIRLNYGRIVNYISYKLATEN